MQRRSKTKTTWPGKMNSFVGGGIASGHGVRESAVKEANEEASVTEDWAKTMVSAGTVSYAKNYKALYRECNNPLDFVLSL